MTAHHHDIYLAIAGAGLVGKRHISAILQCKHIKLCAIIDPHPDIKFYAESLDIPYYISIGDMFKNCKPDGLIIATPNDLHLEHSIEAIEQHCPILIEKPIAIISQDGQKIVDAATSENVPLLVGHHRRHNPLIQAAHASIENGDIGQIRSIHATCWLYKPDDYFDTSPWRKLDGAGPIAVNLVHDIDLLRYLCGDIVSVHAQTSPAIRGYDNEDIACAILRFSNDALCTISVSDTIVAPWSWELTAHENTIYPATQESCYLIGGTHGSLSLPDVRLWQNHTERSWWNPITATSLIRQNNDPLLNQIYHFANVIKGNEQPLVSGYEGLQSLRVVEAIKHSADSGQTIFL